MKHTSYNFFESTLKNSQSYPVVRGLIAFLFPLFPRLWGRFAPPHIYIIATAVYFLMLGGGVILMYNVTTGRVHVL